MKSAFLGLMASALMATAAAAHDFTLGDLKIHHPNIPQPATRAMTAAGYLVIENKGTDADRLIAVESTAAANLQIHTTEHGADGVAKMVHVEALEVPAGETVALERGGYHIMLMGLSKGLVEGDKVAGTLVFEKAGRVDVVFNVEAQKPGEDHSGHGTGGHAKH